MRLVGRLADWVSRRGRGSIGLAHDSGVPGGDYGSAAEFRAGKKISSYARRRAHLAWNGRVCANRASREAGDSSDGSAKIDERREFFAPVMRCS